MNSVTTSINIKRLVLAILLCECVGLIAGFFTRTAIPEWYAFLNKPSFNPPNWIFAPVWTALYVLMGIAFYQIQRNDWNKPLQRRNFVLFWIQLILNFLWTVVFFGLRNPSIAFIIIVALILTIFIWIIELQKIHKPVAYLQIPYLAWCSFAALLNYYIIHLN